MNSGLIILCAPANTGSGSDCYLHQPTHLLVVQQLPGPFCSKIYLTQTDSCWGLAQTSPPQTQSSWASMRWPTPVSAFARGTQSCSAQTTLELVVVTTLHSLVCPLTWYLFVTMCCALEQPGSAPDLAHKMPMSAGTGLFQHQLSCIASGKCP